MAAEIYIVQVNGNPEMERGMNHQSIMEFLKNPKRSVLEVWFPDITITEYKIISSDPNIDGIGSVFMAEETEEEEIKIVTI